MAGGENGVVYSIKGLPNYVVKFNRGINAGKSDEQDFGGQELQAYEMLPEFVPMTIRCHGFRLISVDDKVVTREKGFLCFSCEVSSYYGGYTVLIKERIAGVDLGGVLMALASPEEADTAESLEKPEGCTLFHVAFSKNVYDAVRTLVDPLQAEGQAWRSTLERKVRQQLKCFFHMLANALADKGVALGDGGYWNMMWGANPAGYAASSSLGTDPIEQLWFVDPAVGLWGAWREVVEGAVYPATYGVTHCEGPAPYWHRFPEEGIDLGKDSGFEAARDAWGASCPLSVAGVSQ